jgi:hypothetical protein
MPLTLPQIIVNPGEKLLLKDVNILENNAYIEVEFSSIFPNIPVKEIIPQYLNSCKIDGRNTTMKAFRNYVRKHLGNRE